MVNLLENATATNLSNQLNSTNWFASNINGPLYVFQAPKLYHHAFAMWLGTICVVGVIENALVIHFTKSEAKVNAVADLREGRHALVYYFVNNLAWSDLAGALCTAINIPYFYVELYSERWSCQLLRFTAILFPVLTIYLLTCISIERYIAVVWPFHTLSPKSSVTTVRCGGWCICSVVSIIGAVSYGNHKRFLGDGSTYALECGPAPDPTSRVLFFVFFLMANVIPGKTCEA
ncbi:type-1 angiotensin II receptor A-like [Nematostella vectensis]|uniref:type-1 angiotensin II receptor A-like n=1 Tax=Nematostella vectensis TaxID=45351 RepID=UPI00207755F7|nr:type-1 angiotensin II receptor A-like [Nematostella vectensis]